MKYGLIKAVNFITNRYSTHNEGKSAVSERFIKPLKNKIYKHMKAVSKNVYFDVFNEIVDECNNKCHRTIKMKPIDVISGSFAEYDEESNEKDPTFKVGDHLRISEYKNIFAEGHSPNWSEEVFVIKKVKKTVTWTHVISDLNGEEIAGSFFEKEL